MIAIKETNFAGLKAGDFCQTIDKLLVKLVPVITLKAGYIFTRTGGMRETDKITVLVSFGCFLLLLVGSNKEREKVWQEFASLLAEVKGNKA